MAATATGRRPGLTREQILTAAVAIIDAGGVEALTMRRLGQALDRNPMAIYRHAADKDALLDGVVEHVVADSSPREPTRRDGDGDWEAALRGTAHTFRRAALAHPHVVPLLVTRPLSGPLALRPPGMLRATGGAAGIVQRRRVRPPAPCTPPGCSPGSSTATCCTNCRNRSRTPTRPTTCSASDCTDCPSPSSPGSVPSPPPWPPTTAPPNSTKDSTIVIAGLRSQLRT